MFNPTRYAGPYEPIQIAEWAWKQLRAVRENFANLDSIRLIETHRVPEKPRTGDTYLADGTDWDPGSGQGVYTFYAGAWHKLG